MAYYSKMDYEGASDDYDREDYDPVEEYGYADREHSERFDIARYFAENGDPERAAEIRMGA